MSGGNKIAIPFVGAVVCLALAAMTPFSGQAAFGYAAATFLFGVSFGTWWA